MVFSNTCCCVLRAWDDECRASYVRLCNENRGKPSDDAFAWYVNKELRRLRGVLNTIPRVERLWSGMSGAAQQNAATQTLAQHDAKAARGHQSAPSSEGLDWSQRLISHGVQSLSPEKRQAHNAAPERPRRVDYFYSQHPALNR